MKKFTKSALLFLFSIFILTACGKEESYTSSVPNRQVDILINTTIEHEFNNAFYSKEYPSQGYAGVIVISYNDYNSNLSLAAFDLCCPYEAPGKNTLSQINKLQVQCPNCKSIFNIGDGTGRCQSGPGTERLKSYYVSKNGTSYRISN